MSYHEEDHENCEAPWTCWGCGLQQCPRCHPSPREFTHCANCDWSAA